MTQPIVVGVVTTVMTDNRFTDGRRFKLAAENFWKPVVLPHESFRFLAVTAGRQDYAYGVPMASVGQPEGQHQLTPKLFRGYHTILENHPEITHLYRYSDDAVFHPENLLKSIRDTPDEHHNVTCGRIIEIGHKFPSGGGGYWFHRDLWDSVWTYVTPRKWGFLDDTNWGDLMNRSGCPLVDDHNVYPWRTKKYPMGRKDVTVNPHRKDYCRSFKNYPNMVSQHYVWDPVEWEQYREELSPSKRD